MEYIKNAFFTNFSKYPNIGGDFYINIFLLIAFVILGVGCVILTIYKNSMYRIVKQLRRHKASSEESAKTLSELGLMDFYFVRTLLSGDGMITKLVRRVGQIDYTYDEYKALSKAKKIKRKKLNFREEKFYIPEMANERALIIENNYYSSVARTALMLVLFVMLYIIIMLVMPEILSLINRWLAPVT